MGEIRIIGGQWKRSKLPVPDAPGLRPTSDRVRETLFNWLGQTLTGWRVPYRSALYLPLALLHGSLLLRLAGDLLGRFDWRQAGSLLNGVTLLLFLGLMIALVRLGKTGKRST